MMSINKTHRIALNDAKLNSDIAQISSQKIQTASTSSSTLHSSVISQTNGLNLSLNLNINGNFEKNQTSMHVDADHTRSSKFSCVRESAGKIFQQQQQQQFSNDEHELQCDESNHSLSNGAHQVPLTEEEAKSLAGVVAKTRALFESGLGSSQSSLSKADSSLGNKRLKIRNFVPNPAAIMICSCVCCASKKTQSPIKSGRLSSSIGRLNGQTPTICKNTNEGEYCCCRVGDNISANSKGFSSSVCKLPSTNQMRKGQSQRVLNQVATINSLSESAQVKASATKASPASPVNSLTKNKSASVILRVDNNEYNEECNYTNTLSKNEGSLTLFSSNLKSKPKQSNSTINDSVNNSEETISMGSSNFQSVLSKYERNIRSNSVSGPAMISNSTSVSSPALNKPTKSISILQSLKKRPIHSTRSSNNSNPVFSAERQSQVRSMSLANTRSASSSINNNFFKLNDKAAGGSLGGSVVIGKPPIHVNSSSQKSPVFNEKSIKLDDQIIILNELDSSKNNQFDIPLSVKEAKLCFESLAAAAKANYNSSPTKKSINVTSPSRSMIFKSIVKNLPWSQGSLKSNSESVDLSESSQKSIIDELVKPPVVNDGVLANINVGETRAKFLALQSKEKTELKPVNKLQNTRKSSPAGVQLEREPSISTDSRNYSLIKIKANISEEPLNKFEEPPVIQPNENGTQQSNNLVINTSMSQAQARAKFKFRSNIAKKIMKLEKNIAASNSSFTKARLYPGQMVNSQSNSSASPSSSEALPSSSSSESDIASPATSPTPSTFRRQANGLEGQARSPDSSANLVAKTSLIKHSSSNNLTFNSIRSKFDVSSSSSEENCTGANNISNIKLKKVNIVPQTSVVAAPSSMVKLSTISANSNQLDSFKYSQSPKFLQLLHKQMNNDLNRNMGELHSPEALVTEKPPKGNSCLEKNIDCQKVKANGSGGYRTLEEIINEEEENLRIKSSWKSISNLNKIYDSAEDFKREPRREVKPNETPKIVVSQVEPDRHEDKHDYVNVINVTGKTSDPAAYDSDDHSYVNVICDKSNYDMSNKNDNQVRLSLNMGGGIKSILRKMPAHSSPMSTALAHSGTSSSSEDDPAQTRVNFSHPPMLSSVEVKSPIADEVAVNRTSSSSSSVSSSCSSSSIIDQTNMHEDKRTPFAAQTISATILTSAEEEEGNVNILDDNENENGERLVDEDEGELEIEDVALSSSSSSSSTSLRKTSSTSSSASMESLKNVIKSKAKEKKSGENKQKLLLKLDKPPQSILKTSQRTQQSAKLNENYNIFDLKEQTPPSIDGVDSTSCLMPSKLRQRSKSLVTSNSDSVSPAVTIVDPSTNNSCQRVKSSSQKHYRTSEEPKELATKPLSQENSSVKTNSGISTCPWYPRPQQTKPALFSKNSQALTNGGNNFSKKNFKVSKNGAIASASSARENLLRWCRKMTHSYENVVNIENFSSSWANGMAFCALLHHFMPDEFDFDRLNPNDARFNFDLAFRVAEEKAGIISLLDVDDMIEMGESPDWKCVFTYVHSIYQRFKEVKV